MVQLIGRAQQRGVIRRPSCCLGPLGDAHDLVAADPKALREAHVLAPLVRGAAVARGAQDQKLALAGAEHARAEQKAAQAQPRPEQPAVPGKRGKDVVVAKANLKAGRGA